MPRPYLDKDSYSLLEARMGTVHLEHRLHIETQWESRVFGQGRTFFHIENWYESRWLIRGTLRGLLLHERARRNARSIRLRHNSIAIAGLPAAFDGFTLLHLSDLHLDMAPDMPATLVAAVTDLEYDACVLTGDYRAETYGDFAPAVDGLRELRPHLRDPVYAVLGNHDTLRMIPPVEELGIRILLNESLPLARGEDVIYLAGVDDPHYFRADDLARAARDIPQEAISILLAHTPEIYRSAAQAEFNALLCGHTHGGQICLPGGIPLISNARCPRRFCAGAWRYGTMAGYTSVGSGACVVDVRLNCPPEVTLHRLVAAPH